MVQFSGGVTSWAAARRLVDAHGPDEVLLLLANTNSEATDWMPFVRACQADLGCELVELDNGGRTIWDVFAEEGFIGNSRVDICSRILKRDPLRKWITEHCDPDYHRLVMGFDWEEEHRMARVSRLWEPWVVVAPMTEAPYLNKEQTLRLLKDHGIRVPLAYKQGFEHNNCAGTCVKAGQAHWQQVLIRRPVDYLRAEKEEQKLREKLGDVSILVEQIKGEKVPLSLSSFRERLGYDLSDYDHDDFGSCSCMDGYDS